MLPSTIAVLRSHIKLFEVMAARLEELSTRTSDSEESATLRNFAKAYEVLALQHRAYLGDAAEVKAA